MVYSIENFRYDALKMQGPLLTSTTWGLASSAIFFVIAYAFFGLPLIPTVISAAAFGTLGGCMQYQALQSTKEPTGAKGPTPQLLDLPNEILWNIMDTLLESDPVAAVRFGRTCRKAHTVFEERSFYFNPTAIPTESIQTNYFEGNDIRAEILRKGAQKYIAQAHRQPRLQSRAPSPMQPNSPTYTLSASQTKANLSLLEETHLKTHPSQMSWNDFERLLKALEYLTQERDALSKMQTQQSPLKSAVRLLVDHTVDLEIQSRQLQSCEEFNCCGVTVRAFRILVAIWKYQNSQYYEKAMLNLLEKLGDYSHSEWVEGHLNLYEISPKVFYTKIASYQNPIEAFRLIIAVGLQMYTGKESLLRINTFFTKASSNVTGIEAYPALQNYYRFKLLIFLATRIHTGQFPDDKTLFQLGKQDLEHEN